MSPVKSVSDCAVAVIAVFELARDQEYTNLMLLMARHTGKPDGAPGHAEVLRQRARYNAAQNAVEALQTYADLIAAHDGRGTH